jgi:hypothetical protein
MIISLQGWCGQFSFVLIIAISSVYCCRMSLASLASTCPLFVVLRPNSQKNVSRPPHVCCFRNFSPRLNFLVFQRKSSPFPWCRSRNVTAALVRLLVVKLENAVNLDNLTKGSVIISNKKHPTFEQHTNNISHVAFHPSHSNAYIHIMPGYHHRSLDSREFLPY